MPRLFASHMVLQRDRPVHVWGEAAPAEHVQVHFRGNTAAGIADGLGRWSVYLPPGQAGGPFALVVDGTNRVELTDVLVGDLWLASGQSNMEFSMAPAPPWTEGVQNDAAEIASAVHPELRLFKVKAVPSAYPADDLTVQTAWTACTPASVAGFSAVAYFFGREIVEQEKVPVGLIEADLGGTPAEAWTSLDALTADPALLPVFQAHAHMMDDQAAVLLQERAEAEAAALARAQGRAPAPPPWRPDPTTWAPAVLFNGLIAPLTPLPIQGILWYQGESNTGPERAPLYDRLFPALIGDWRTRWAEGTLPFLFVQLANFNSTDDWPTVREAQRRTLALANTGMAVTIDVGDPGRIHPRDKQDVGHRLALWARVLSYHEQVEDSGPLFRQAVPEGKGMRIWFDHVGQGLLQKGPVLRSFEIAGADRRFVAASAVLEGNTVVASSASVPSPRYVRYGWASAPECTLFNREGLPASPFSSAP